ncbi:MAG: hypothetical protein PWQ37_449 [Candidatus Petromonas sp.]|nr:hypothetical protein [Candidatus Petromonas sp.]
MSIHDDVFFDDYIGSLYRRRPRPPFEAPPFFEQPDRPPFGPPMGPPGAGGAPTGAPPAFTPERPAALLAVDPGAIRRCRYKFTYLWLDNGREFWAYLVFIGRRSVSGFRWTGRRWVYFGTDLRNIDYFECF